METPSSKELVVKKGNQFTVEEHNDLINTISTAIEALKQYKERLPAREATKLLVQSITRINELYTSDMMSDQNKEEE